MLPKNQIKEIQSLHLKKGREARGLFIAEGMKTVAEVLRFKPECVRDVYATADFIKAHPLTAQTKANVVEVSDDELRKISLQNTPNQALAVCHKLNTVDQTFDFEKAFTFYLDDIRDPGNLGTIIRLADWFGITQLYGSNECCEFYNPKVIQASMGAFLRVQLNYLPLPELLRSQTVSRVYGAVLNGKDVYAQPLGGGLILIGNEANGIREENLGLITHPITIPAKYPQDEFRGESLNAAMAASILASEFFRQLQH